MNVALPNQINLNHKCRNAIVRIVGVLLGLTDGAGIGARTCPQQTYLSQKKLQRT